MNSKIDKEIRYAIAYIAANNIKLIQGAWFTFDKYHNVKESDPIGAVILRNNLIGVSSFNLDNLRTPGYLRVACRHLEVDVMWMRRFFLGFDRNYQAVLFHEKDNKTIETKDEVSAYGIQLYKEFIKR